MEKYIKLKLKSKICKTCKVKKEIKYFGSQSATRDGLRPSCKSCRRLEGQKYQSVRYKTDTEYREKCLLASKASGLKLKLELIRAYGGCCVCCGEVEPEFLTVEHINGDGIKQRIKFGAGRAYYWHLRKLDFPKDGLTLLCMNCNFASRKGNICPHKKI